MIPRIDCHLILTVLNLIAAGVLVIWGKQIEKATVSGPDISEGKITAVISSMLIGPLFGLMFTAWKFMEENPNSQISWDLWWLLYGFWSFGLFISFCENLNKSKTGGL